MSDKTSLSEKINGLPKITIFVISLLFIIFIGFVDYITGPEISFSIFYLIPIAFATWYDGTTQGIIISFVSSMAWFMADTLSGHIYSNPTIGYWAANMRLGYFIIITYLLGIAKNTYFLQKKMASNDFLTGIANSRHFFETVTNEINDTAKNMKPITIVYIDIDNFKTINDTFGHMTGDQLLRSVGTTIKNNIRSTDTVARLGGDEFGILLKEANYDQSQVIINKVQMILLNLMERNNWPITFSVGAITFISPMGSVDEMIGMTDKIMYMVKNSGKNAIRHEIYENKIK